MVLRKMKKLRCGMFLLLAGLAGEAFATVPPVPSAPTVTPEPTSLLIWLAVMGTGAVSFWWYRRKKRPD